MDNQPTTRYRLQSIDVLRGLVMVIMALDHVRDFFHVDAITVNPLNLATTTYPLFFTRWITHFCAPVFVFLSGMSAFLNGQKKTKNELSIFLLKRGLWLIVVEIVIMSLAFTFNPRYNFIFLEVIWAIGISMVLLAILIHLPYRVLLIIGLLVFFSHNLLDYPEAARKGNINIVWGILHGRAAVIPLNSTHLVFVAYSFLPWTGLMILGYCCGKLFTAQLDAAFRRKTLLRMGFALVTLFIVLRFMNVYGDPFAWSTQKNSGFTFLSFMNANKYPPSLIYCCMTIGPALILLALIDNIQNRFTAFLTTYGSVPLFYFVLHFFFIHLLCVVLFFASGYSMKDAFNPQVPFGFRPPEFGYSLGMVYLIWLGIVLTMYPLCRMYGRFKRRHGYWWLSYL